MSRSKIEVYEKLLKMTFAEPRRPREHTRANDAASEGRKAHPLWLFGHLTFATDAI